MTASELIKVGIAAGQSLHMRRLAQDTKIVFAPPGTTEYLCVGPDLSHDRELVRLSKWTDGEFSVHMGYSWAADTLVVQMAESLEL